MTEPRTAWIGTYTGKTFQPFEPRVADVSIGDIAHALSMICRWAGHTSSFYSVAQHSVLMAAKAPPALAMQALLHDAPEAYLGDIPRPLKRHMASYVAAEAAVWEVIAKAFDVPEAMHPVVKALDDAILVDERRTLMAPGLDYGLAGPGLGITIVPWAPARAESEFLGMFWQLRARGRATTADAG